MNEIFILDKAKGQLIEKSTVAEPAPYQFNDVNVFEEHYRAWQQHISSRRSIPCSSRILQVFDDRDELRINVHFNLAPGSYIEAYDQIYRWDTIRDGSYTGDAIAIAVPIPVQTGKVAKPAVASVSNISAELLQHLLKEAGYIKEGTMWVNHKLQRVIFNSALFSNSEQ